ncbi:MAG: hypothetical protein IPM60_09875 [Rhodospirillales bacterium]|nr:hypothetical protein [Rhodospirillales bacterium]
MRTPPLGNVLLGAHSQYRGLLTALAGTLQERFGARVHLFCASRQEAHFYRTRFGSIFASITVADLLYRTCAEPVDDGQGVFAEARDNEAWLGVTINLLAISDRHLGRGYALGGFKHPRSVMSQRTNYAQMVNAHNAAIAFWRRHIEETDADLLINCGKIADTVAGALGVPRRILAGSRFRNYHYWATSEFREHPALAAAYDRIGAPDDLSLLAPYESHLQMRQVFTRQYTLSGTLQTMAKRAAQQAYWRLRGYDKARGYYVTEDLSYVWRRFRDARRLADAASTPLAALSGRRFVYYPLHTEPETALQTLSPEYFYQLSAIAALSRDLPAGVLLAVKETLAAIGRRPTDFYAQIREFKNVVMLDPREYGLEVARAADAVATITGTGGFEAAVMGRPVISFGRHNLYNLLPHVAVVEDELDLAGQLRHALDGVDRVQAKRDGARFLQAVVETSFDLGGYRVTEPDVLPTGLADTVADALIRSLPTSDATAGAAVEAV